MRLPLRIGRYMVTYVFAMWAVPCSCGVVLALDDDLAWAIGCSVRVISRTFAESEYLSGLILVGGSGSP